MGRPAGCVRRAWLGRWPAAGASDRGPRARHAALRRSPPRGSRRDPRAKDGCGHRRDHRDQRGDGRMPPGTPAAADRRRRRALAARAQSVRAADDHALRRAAADRRRTRSPRACASTRPARRSGPDRGRTASVGRAVRLLLLNVGGGTPVEIDKATMGHPGKFTYCIAENESASPWSSLRAERGFGPDVSTVTRGGRRGAAQHQRSREHDRGRLAHDDRQARWRSRARTTSITPASRSSCCRPSTPRPSPRTAIRRTTCAAPSTNSRACR